MNISLPKKKILKMQAKQLEDALFFLYLCFPLITAVFANILSVWGISSYGRIAALVFTCFPLLLLLGMRKCEMIFDFWALFVFIVCFFAITYAVHPEYRYWYSREDYGVLNYVFWPDNGIYIFLLIRMINDPKRIIKCIKVSGWPMYVYYARQTAAAISRGYWIDISTYGRVTYLSYNLSLGYNLLIFELVFLYCALEERKWSDWVGVIIGIAIILCAGSRGPILDIIIFLILYVLIKVVRSRKKIVLIISLILLAGIAWIAYPFLIALLSEICNKMNISSRFITKLLNGTITDDAGRWEIWSMAIGMIRENPFGYGAMGSRHVIGNYVYVGHPHQFFLEIFIDFGVVIGAVIIMWLMVSSFKILTMKGIEEWKGVFIIFFARACQLLLSLTYWHSIGLWGVLAVGMCIYLSKREKVIYGRE